MKFKKSVCFSALAFLLIFTSSISYALGYTYGQAFSDVENDDWYFDSVQRLWSLGIVEGYEDQSFRPTGNVNRAEMAVMMSRMLDAIENGCIYNDTFVIEGATVQSVEDVDVYLACEAGEVFEAYVEEPEE